MGRRSIATMTPQEIRKQTAKTFRNLVHAHQVNLVQFEAQLVETEMLAIIVGFAKNEELPPQFRKECANDVIKYARGPIAPWFHDGQTINPKDIGNTGMTIEAEIEASKSLSLLHSRLDELVRQNVPPDQWPEDVRLAAGDLIGVFEATDDDDSKTD